MARLALTLVAILLLASDAHGQPPQGAGVPAVVANVRPAVVNIATRQLNIDWRQNLRPDGTFKSREELRALYASRAVTPDKTVVTCCQTHHRAAHTYFVLRLQGDDRSWSEWGNRDDVSLAR